MTPTQPTAEQLRLAQECACQAVEVYGEGDAREHDAAVLRTLWNDHPAVQSALLAIQATEARMAAAVEALNGYQAAVAFVAADAWDGCPDCIDILKAARCADTVESLTPDEIAANLKRIRPHYQPAIRSQSNG